MKKIKLPGKITTPEYELAKQAAAVLKQNNFAAYIIGGAVRDLWLGKEPKDFDLVTNARPEEIIKISEFSQAKYKDPAQAFGVTRVKFFHQGLVSEIEIATFRKDIEAHKGRKQTKVVFAEIEDDVMRRDFTINALALDPDSGEVFDYVGGVKDLKNKLIRFIGEPKNRIKEDPLRIMRAIRFKNQLKFSYSPATVIAIKEAIKKRELQKIATDRLRDELTYLLVHPSRSQAVKDLYGFGILNILLPEVSAGKGVDQPEQFHAEGDVWQHELLILDYLPNKPSRRLAWAALLHDIGKRVTITQPTSPDDRIHFNRHYGVGAEMAKAIMRRLNFSNRDVNDVWWMIYNHMAIDDLPNMRPSKQQKMLGHPAFEDLLELHRADAAASWHPDKPHQKPEFKKLEKLWQEYHTKTPEKRQPSLKKDLGIDGEWLINHFGEEFALTRGPVIGQVLKELDERYRDEGIKDKNFYLKKAREILRAL